MKILHISTNYYGSEAFRRIVRISQTMHETAVFVPAKKKANIPKKSDQNILIFKHFRIWHMILYKIKIKNCFNFVSKKLSKIDFKANLIHAHTLFLDGGIAYLLNRRYGTKYIVTIRNTDVNSYFKYMIFSRSYGVKILKNASKIILLSPSFKKTIFTKYVPKKYWKEILSKIEIVPNGVDEFWFVNKDTKISKINDGAIKLLYVGRFYFNKNIFRILLIQYKLLMMGFTSTLTLIGNTNQSLFEKIIYKFAAKIKNTIVLPKLPKEALLRHYKESSIYVMPSHYESFGLTYVEALTQGKPIIYTKNQGIDGFFKNGSIGYAVNSKNTGEIICAIHKIVRNYCATSANCLIACERFEWENIEKKYLQMLSLFDDC